VVLNDQAGEALLSRPCRLLVKHLRGVSSGMLLAVSDGQEGMAMKAYLAPAIAAAAVLLLSGPVQAHHPFAAEFNKDKPVHIMGTVTKVDWSNPHAVLQVDERTPDGHMTSWTFELGGPAALKRRGWTQATLKNGDEVTVDGWLARDHEHRANAKMVKLGNGKELNAASSYFDKPAKGNSH
jgi:hypothetical protein